MKRILTAALALALTLSLTACGGAGGKGFDGGKLKEGLCYEATGIAPDAVAMKVDGVEVPMDMYFYNLCYTASYMESFMSMYGMAFDWDMELEEGETMLDAVKASALDNVKSFIVIEKLAQENGVELDAEDIEQLAQQRAELMEELGGEEAYYDELAKIGLREDTYDRMCRSDYLYDALSELAATEGSSLNPTDDELLAYAAEQGYMTADHILLATKDLSTYEDLDEETIAQKRALADELKAKLDAYTGDDLAGYFAQLADEYSEDSGRAANPEGYTFGSGQMDESFEQAAAALAEGEICDPVEGFYGYHIILRKPLDKEAAIEAVRGGYLEKLLESGMENAVVEMNPLVEALDVRAVYEAFNAAVSDSGETDSETDGETGSAADGNAGGSTDGETAEDGQESGENG